MIHWGTSLEPVAQTGISLIAVAEEELIRKNEDLNALNEETTATQEELHQNVDELIREGPSTGRLQKKKSSSPKFTTGSRTTLPHSSPF